MRKPKYIEEFCCDCNHYTLHQYILHNSDEIKMRCSECGVNLYVGFDIYTVRKFKTLEELEGEGEMKRYKVVDPEVSRQEMTRVLVKGLGRALTDQEAKTLFWLSECDYETKGVILDIFKELTERQE